MPSEAVRAFVDEKTIAIVGVSRSGKGFGAAARRELAGKGYRVLIVHPGAGEIDGQPCWASLAELPEKPGGVLVTVPPAEAEKVVREAAAAGIRKVWLMRGAEWPGAADLGAELGLSLVQRECILMYADPKGVHAFHRFFARLLGKA